mmetsp:Transcript_25695/g.46958  ORF Transcript_25695/g.46958 Transcript_25695/m.46958 type:complete len:202 (+) Transcript_25695:131-736(+)
MAMKTPSECHSRGTSRRSSPSMSHSALSRIMVTASWASLLKDLVKQCARKSCPGACRALDDERCSEDLFAWPTSATAAFAPPIDAKALYLILASSQMLDSAARLWSALATTKMCAFGGSRTKPTSRDTMRLKFRKSSCCSSSIWPLMSTSSSASSSCTATLSNTALCCLIASAKPKLVWLADLANACIRGPGEVGVLSAGG